ncbi:MAG: hypothetical protein DHS20C12_11910 [Pseudohongiella sp.]|nr:MAG: hypothetical protein DHS20C12_11910 [Pseudohongiella sp.]
MTFLELLQAGLLGIQAIREAVEKDTELRDYMDIIRGALEAERKARVGDEEVWVLIPAVYEDRVVVEEDGRYYSYPYTVSEDREVTLGERSEVIREFTAVDASKSVSGAMVEAIANSGDEDKPLAFRIRVIRSGLSGNGNFYPDSCLREAVPLFEGARVFIKSDQEHLRGQGKDVRNLVGQLTDASFIEGNGGANTGEIQAIFEVFESEVAVASKLKEAIERNMQNLFGFSVDVDGQVIKKGKIREAVKFTKVHSVDFIVEPGAGGELINLIEAVGSNNNEEEDTMLERMLAKLREANGGKLPAGLDETDEDAVLAAYNKTLREAAPVDDNNDDEGGDKPLTRAELKQFELRATMREAVRNSNLPEKAQAKVLAGLDRETNLTEERISEAIEDERSYLASLTESGKVNSLAFPGGDASVDGVTEMLDKLFDPADDEVFSIRECYQEATGDGRVTGRTSEMRSMRLSEAISSTTFPELLGSAMQRRMIDRYNGESRFDVYNHLVSADTPFTDFRERKGSRVGGYGALPIVAENGAYGALTSPSEEAFDASPSKRGGTETVSLETIKNDDVSLVTKLPGRLGTAAKRTLAKFVMDFVRSNGNIYDAKALFHADHNNLGTTALDKAAYTAARLAMMQQGELGVLSERMALSPAVLLVPQELEEAAFNIFQRGTNVDKDYAESSAPKIVSVWYWTDANDWVLVADPNDTDLIEIGFLDNKKEPELFLADSPTQGSMFTNDQLVYKVRHIYGGAVADYRGMRKAVVA